MKLMNFVIFHKNLLDEHYSVDPSFSHDYFTFIKCNQSIKPSFNLDYGYRVINEYDLKEYNAQLQKKMYMAPSAIYHVFKNGLYKNYDYVGFLEYDIILKSIQPAIPKTVTKHIIAMCEQNPNLIAPYSFQHPLSRLFGQKDIKNNGINAMEQIVYDYNHFFGTKYDPLALAKLNELATSQQSFLTDVKTFESIMEFIAYVIENKLAERPNSWHRPSTLLDRYFAVALYFAGDPKPLYLKHASLKQWKDPNGISFFLKRLGA